MDDVSVKDRSLRFGAADDGGTLKAFLLCAAVCAAAMMLRACFCGVSYTPILDDTVQYLNYPRSLNYAALIEREGLLASRPLAGLSDLYLTGRFGSCLIVPVLFLSFLHGVSAALFRSLFERYFGTSQMFAVLFALLPVGCEGTYWLSASTRIVPGLFFTACAAWLLERFMDRGGLWRLPLYFVLLLLSFGFYEQILCVSVTLAGLQFLTFVRRNRCAWGAFVTFAALFVYFAFTNHFAAQGALGGRIATVFPTEWRFYKPYALDVIRQIGDAGLKGTAYTFAHGFLRGIRACVTSAGGIAYLLLSLVLGGAFVALSGKTSDREARCRFPMWGAAAVWSVLLILAPMSPYFVIENPYYSLRAVVPSLVGAALLGDLILRAILRREIVVTVVAGILIPVFLVCGASEIADYREASAADEEIAAVFMRHLDEFHGRVGIFGLPSYSGGQNYPFHEHVQTSASSGWALYAKIVDAAYRQDIEEDFDFDPVPLETDVSFYYHGWNRVVKRTDSLDQFWYYDAGTLKPLTVVQTGDAEHRFYLPGDDDPLCVVWEEEEEDGDVYGYFRWMQDRP